MPPGEEATVIFPKFIFQDAILGIGTVIGIISFGGRIFDAISDPIIANFSDRVAAKNGKRKRLMGIAAFPLALLSFLVFFPLSDTGFTINTVWLISTVLLFYLAFTMYVIPYTALISELGHHPDDRMKISTFISIAFAVGYIIGSTIYALQDVFADAFQMDILSAFQLSVLAFAVLGLLCMLTPVFFLQETKYSVQSHANIDIKGALQSVWKNVSFRYFLWSDLMYWLALTFIQLGISYYTVALFDLGVEVVPLFNAVGFLTSFLLYIPINYLVKKYSKARLINTAFLAFVMLFMCLAVAPFVPLPNEILFYGLAVFSGFPLACFGIIPNAIIADEVHIHESQTGLQQSGMFYGVRNFVMKLGISIATLIFPSLLLFGKSAENPLGVQLAASAAALFCGIGWLLFQGYRRN